MYNVIVAVTFFSSKLGTEDFLFQILAFNTYLKILDFKYKEQRVTVTICCMLYYYVILNGNLLNLFFSFLSLEIINLCNRTFLDKEQMR